MHDNIGQVALLPLILIVETLLSCINQYCCVVMLILLF